ncbi:MAG: transporter substrate-binding domain-containing protein [Nocardioides sp.]|uniref:transporter substrate-binding domain-containing protein n=1 Tax=Nocardioides sp. TaxID=35761 RepID=UPI003F011602
MIIRPLAAGLSAAALALALTACGSDSSEDKKDSKADGSTASVATIADGKLTVCSDVPYAPFEQEDASAPSGFSGFDIDVIQYIADGLGLELSVVPTAFAPIQSGAALNASQCDVAASAITINEERKANLDFTDAYFDSEQSLLVPEGSDIASIADLDGAKVGVQDATTGQAYATDNAKGAEIVAFPDDGKMFQAIKSGAVDALLQDLGVNALHQTEGGFTIVETYDTAEQYGFAIKKGNTELLEAVNEQLAEMRESGEYDTVHAKYFG